MKNKIFAVFLSLSALFFNAHIAFSDNIQNLITEVKVFDNDTTYKLNYLYDSQRNMVLETKSFLNVDNWVYLSQIEWMFENSVRTKQIQRVWKQNKWIDNAVIENIEVQGVQTELFSNYVNELKINYKKSIKQFAGTKISSKQDFMYVGNEWLLKTTQNFYFNEKLLLDSSLITTNSPLDTIVKYKFIYSYNPDSTLISQIVQMAGDQSEFSNSSMNVWYYKPGTKLISSMRSKIWNSKTLKWENSSMIVNEYDSLQNLISETYYTWNVMFWTNNLRYNYQYDDLKHIVNKQLEIPIFRQWRNTISINYYEINENYNQVIESVYGFWGGKTGELVSSYVPYKFNDETVIQRAKKISVNYSIYNVTDQNLNITKKGLIKVFPNPSEGIFYINLNEYKIDSWKIADINGKIVKQQNINQNSGVIDITELPRGIYILSVIAAGEILYQKLSKI